MFKNILHDLDSKIINVDPKILCDSKSEENKPLAKSIAHENQIADSDYCEDK